jgi:uncharacterized protein (TIGR03067 family)
MTILRDRFEISSSDGQRIYEGSLKLEPARLVKRVDFLHDAGQAKGKIWLGVYSIEGDVLRVCDNAPDPARPRPDLFGAPAGAGLISVLLRREKP